MSLLTENGHVLDVLLFQLVSTRGDSYACLFSDNPNDDRDPSKMNHVMKFCVLCKYNNIMVINILWLTTRRFFGYLLLKYIVWYSCIILFDGVWPYGDRMVYRVILMHQLPSLSAGVYWHADNVASRNVGTGHRIFSVLIHGLFFFQGTMANLRVR